MGGDPYLVKLPACASQTHAYAGRTSECVHSAVARERSREMSSLVSGTPPLRIRQLGAVRSASPRSCFQCSMSASAVGSAAQRLRRAMLSPSRGSAQSLARLRRLHFELRRCDCRLCPPERERCGDRTRTSSMSSAPFSLQSRLSYRATLALSVYSRKSHSDALAAPN